MRVRLLPVASLSSLSQAPWVDTSRRPYIQGNDAFVPVKPGYAAHHEIPERRRKGRGYQIIGDIIAFHGREPSPAEVDEVWSRERPRGIIWITGHESELRTPVIRIISGEVGEVIHRESGLSYLLDVRTVMFSQGNRNEKSRVAGQVRPGERTCDMFAGIGYFTLGLARAGALVHAIEINPVSFQYLVKNSQMNHLTRHIRAVCGDCRYRISGVYERIHMGHFHAVSFLPVALSHSSSGTVLHVHMIGDRSAEIDRVLQHLGYRAGVEVHRVKKTGPGTWHMVADVVIE